MSHKIAACKLCGGVAREVDRVNANTVTCTECGLTVKQSEMGRGDAVERWYLLNENPSVGTRFSDADG